MTILNYVAVATLSIIMYDFVGLKPYKNIYIAYEIELQCLIL